jgi:hypothetical protein
MKESTRSHTIALCKSISGPRNDCIAEGKIVTESSISGVLVFLVYRSRRGVLIMLGGWSLISHYYEAWLIAVVNRDRD